MFRLVCSLLVVCLFFGAEAKKTHVSKLKAIKKSASDSTKNETARLDDSDGCPEGEDLTKYSGCMSVKARLDQLEEDVTMNVHGPSEWQVEQVEKRIEEVRSDLGWGGEGVGDPNTAFARIRSAEEEIEGLKINLGQSHLGYGPSPAFDEINDLRGDIDMIRTNPQMLPEWLTATIDSISDDIRSLKEKLGNDGTTDARKLKAMKKSMSDSVKKEKSTTRLADPCSDDPYSNECAFDLDIANLRTELENVRMELKTVKITASIICQTGELQTEGAIPDPDGYQWPVTFSPRFAFAPTVTMAISKLEIQETNPDDFIPGAFLTWKFRQEARDISESGFSAFLFAESHPRSDQRLQSVVWIACGETDV